MIHWHSPDRAAVTSLGGRLRRFLHSGGAGRDYDPGRANGNHPSNHLSNSHGCANDRSCGPG